MKITGRKFIFILIMIATLIGIGFYICISNMQIYVGEKKVYLVVFGQTIQQERHNLDKNGNVTKVEKIVIKGE